MSIKLSNFSAFYGYRRILSNLNISLQPGSCTGLIGPNGAGKSTLMKGILGLISTSGEIYFDDLLVQNNGLTEEFQNFRAKKVRKLLKDQGKFI